MLKRSVTLPSPAESVDNEGTRWTRSVAGFASLLLDVCILARRFCRFAFFRLNRLAS